MDRFEQVYTTGAAQYDQLVRKEDQDGNIETVLQDIYDVSGRDVVEIGAGTGRLTMMVAPDAGSIIATDASAHMLSVTREKLQASGLENWSLLEAQSHQMPLTTGCADLTLAGWVFGHVTAWEPKGWRKLINRSLAEMARLTRRGGMMVIFETMGTCTTAMEPPTDDLAAYYQWLEKAHGFQARRFRTDYQFDSVEEAETLIRFFFGDELAERVVENQWVIVPEGTGVWWKRR